MPVLLLGIPCFPSSTDTQCFTDNWLKTTGLGNVNLLLMIAFCGTAFTQTASTQSAWGHVIQVSGTKQTVTEAGGG